MKRALTVPAPFELALVVKSHGWYDLPPFHWDGARLVRPVTLAGEGFVATVWEEGDTVWCEVRGERRMGTRRFEAVAQVVNRCLGLEDDLSGFHARAAGDTRLDWVARRGGGRLLRSPTRFEDAVKILTTVNMSWAGSRGMVARLVDGLGVPAPGGTRDFPSAGAIARAPKGYLKDVIRAGYRAPWIRGLAEAVADGRLDLESVLAAPEDEARRTVAGLTGFGPYATDLLLRLSGHGRGLALDSWCSSRLMETRGRRKPPTRQQIERWFRPWGPWAGLALWCELTAGWHGESR